LSQFKKYHLSGNLKCNNSGIFISLKLRNLMGKVLPISLKLNFTPNILGCYGLIPKIGVLTVGEFNGSCHGEVSEAQGR